MALFAHKPWTKDPASPGSSSTPIEWLVVFTDNDAGYLAWLTANPAGFVVNALLNPNPSNLVLHQTTCRTITGQPTRGSGWTGAYVKMCSTNLAALNDWASREVGGELRPCGSCRPLM